MKTGFKGLASTVMGAFICAAFASCTALGPSDEPGAGTSDVGTGSPDLMVASPTVSDDGPAAGAPFTLSATVRNAGDGASESTTLRYYRSTDAEISSSDAEVGTEAVAELAASATSSQSVSLPAPTNAGTYYYGACVDAVKGESDTANNCSSSLQIAVPEPEPGPNLAVTSPAVTNSAPAVGTTFTVSALVRNDGDEASVVTTMRFYRSTDATITTSDTEVGTDTVGGLSPTGTSSQSATSSSQSGKLASTEDSGTYYYHGELEIDAPTTPGTYYYGACVDAVTDESDTTNNCSSSAKVTVRSSEQQVEGTPDLSPYTIVVEAGLDDLSAGESFSLSVGVRNDGNGSSAATTLRYYRSTDTTVTTSDTEVGTDDLPSLAPSATSSQSVSLTAPTMAGTYYYGACVESVTGESDTTNNCSESVTITVDGDPPDLVVLGPGVGSGSRDPGEMFRLLVTVHNQGAGGSAATTVRFYRSTDTTITTSDALEGTGAVNALVPSGGSGETILLTAPSSAGTYHYGACVDAVPRESDTTNNCSTSVQVTVPRPEEGPAPDLVVGAPSVTNFELDVGATFTLSATVTNDGDAASAATTLRYYRSTDELIKTSDTEVDTDEVEELAAAGTSDESVDLTAPSTAGIYYYGACVDSVTGESDTTNNCSESVPVDVTELSHRPVGPALAWEKHERGCMLGGINS